MPLTDAQKRAMAKYRSEKTKSVNLTFYPAEMDLYAYLGTVGVKQAYIKGLIRADMERKAAENQA